MKTYAYVVLSAIALNSCSPGGSKQSPLPEKALIALYADILITREQGNILNKDSTEIMRETDSVLVYYQTSQSELDESLAARRKNLATWKEFYGNVSLRLEELQKDTLRQK